MLDLMVDARNMLGECVLWCERSDRVLWTDILGATLYAHHPASGRTEQWAMPERLACFALTGDDDRLLLGLASRLAFFDFSSGAVTPVCAVEAHLPSTRVNDGRCDRQGRFVFGTFNEAEPRPAIGGFYRLNGDLTLERLDLQDVGIANSICFSPDGATMYYCDSQEKKIRCCSYDPVSGAVGGARVFAELGAAGGEPDGSTIDADGNLWNALWGARKVVCYTPDGRVGRELALPASQPSCVAFGGPELGTAYVTSARVGLDAATLAAEPSAGGVFSATLAGVRGLPEQRFGCL
ncbi:SMP-30/gluconolactonase/LRE family protein [Massilia glaciei]|uniref:SMP-30/gluconolactonase/LRE family protein n=1 Tax=Massilia glaciei TaxID=1524097 RepID=A0A2U2HDT9_9BURK|nr:SMP-30/gluconolactonase/LRE family protein [Massilia glaciei]PWF41428.1 SMP-30/gluconolactonase/LRE family protein [Massilia glaciei]